MNRVISYIGSPDWIKNKKVTINLINKNDKNCFQHDGTLASNHQKIEKKNKKKQKE